MREGSPVIIVSGLPRSGTSMMMRMLEAAGLAVLTDGRREADDDNPQGYYELESVKGLYEGRTDWLDDAEGRVVKIVSPLLPYLPDDREYRVVLMRRDLDEVLASQRKMLAHRGEPVREMDDAKLAEIYAENLREVDAWARSRPGIEAELVDFNELLADPLRSLEQLRGLFGHDLDVEAMAAVVDPALYRNRRD